MINQRHLDRLVYKTQKLADVYEKFRVTTSLELNFLLFETKEHFGTPPENQKYKTIKNGDKWGSDFSYGWFKCVFSIPQNMRKEQVYLQCDNGAIENLVFLNGRTFGMFDYIPNAADPQFRTHKYLKLPKELNETAIQIDMEGYASHAFAGWSPYHDKALFAMKPGAQTGNYQGIRLVTFDVDVDEFLDNIYLLEKLFIASTDKFLVGELSKTYEELFEVLELMPNDYAYLDGIEKANQIMNKLFCKKQGKRAFPYIGILGHSHLDTAWLWPIEETKRKAARTVSNAVQMLKTYPEYRFIFSSAVHLDWIKTYEPDLFAEVKKLVKEGRFEPNGGAWVECDCNLTGSESLVRQFIIGQKFLREELDYEADTFWLPDTFGYSAALPQILSECNIKYFCTTKMSWNDTNVFPYDSFIWEGIDRSSVTAHLNCLHCYADPETVIKRAEQILNKHLTQATLITYGFGDGGGGPNYKMVEYAIKTAKMPYLPKVEHTTASAFMSKITKSALPKYKGELYLELHRGTLTSIHEMKKTNRQLETALHNLEFLSATLSTDKKQSKNISDDLYKTILLNQFHDILPGTSINRVNDIAIAENEEAIKKAEKISSDLLQKNAVGEGMITLINALSFDRSEITEFDGNVEFDGEFCQTYSDIDGKQKTSVLSFVEAFSTKKLVPGKAVKKEFFKIKENKFETPFYIAALDKKTKQIISLYDKHAKRMVIIGQLNRYAIFEDVPCDYDNWDIDRDYMLKEKVTPQILSSELVSCETLELRIRNKYRLSEKSTITVDTIFYSMLSRIDFVCKLDWYDTHRLLKTFFPTNILSDTLKSEIQFGHIDRQMTENNSLDLAKFEVSNIKWSDISETNYGAALLNDCKYGISLSGSTLGLTLIKGGTHPDDRADAGIKTFKYSLLPHIGGFSAQNVVLPAYSFNNNYIKLDGTANLNCLVKIDKPNIICETIKIAENNEDIILRLYECEKSRTKVNLTFNSTYNIVQCNILEDEKSLLSKHCKSIEIEFAPFQIITLRLRDEKTL